jgi:peptidoglycan LD-endopeptidase LytH
VTRHEYEGRALYALHGHLSRLSVEAKRIGQTIRRGEVIAWIGDRSENGNWPPHVHFQLSWEDPGIPDMPGVVNEESLAEALKRFPDPRIVLGPIF